MRPTPFLMLIWLLAGGSGPGVLAGAAVAGLLAMLTGQVHWDAWLIALVGLVPMGAAGGAITARLTRYWLAPRLQHRRYTLFTAAGALTLPLAAGMADMHQFTHAAAVCFLGGGMCTVILRIRAFNRDRAATLRRRAGYPPPTVR